MINEDNGTRSIPPSNSSYVCFQFYFLHWIFVSFEYMRSFNCPLRLFPSYLTLMWVVFLANISLTCTSVCVLNMSMHLYNRNPHYKIEREKLKKMQRNTKNNFFSYKCMYNKIAKWHTYIYIFIFLIKKEEFFLLYFYLWY